MRIHACAGELIHVAEKGVHGRVLSGSSMSLMEIVCLFENRICNSRPMFRTNSYVPF